MEEKKINIGTGLHSPLSGKDRNISVVVLDYNSSEVIIKRLTDEEIDLYMKCGEDCEEFMEHMYSKLGRRGNDCCYMIGDNIHVEKI